VRAVPGERDGPSVKGRASAPVEVRVLGSAPPSIHTVRRHLPAHWSVFPGTLGDRLSRSKDPPDLYLLRGRVRAPPGAGRSHAVVRILPPRAFRGQASTRPEEVVLSLDDLDRLAETAYALIGSRWALPEDLRTRLSGLPWVLRRALLLLLVEPLPTPVEAAEALAKGDAEPYPRRVGALARRVGMSRSTLQRAAREAGLSLSEVVRTATLLRALIHRRLSAEPWETVALRLGFRSGAAWANFVVRLTGRPPTGLRVEDLAWWQDRFIGLVASGAA